MREPAKSGLTVVELLVVISIIAVLLALLLAGVQASREAARRVGCQARLANLGKALQQYESAKGSFPPTVKCTSPSARGTYCPWQYSPHTHLLPYLDQQVLFARVDFKKKFGGTWDPRFFPEMTTSLEVFHCPADRAPSGERPGNSYCVSMGTGPGHLPRPAIGEGDDGAFTGTKPLRAAAFVDGLGMTIGMSEKRIGGWDGSRFQPDRDAWYSNLYGLIGRFPTADETIATCGSLTGPPPAYFRWGGSTWMVGAFGTTWFNHALPPNSPIPDCSVGPPDVEPQNQFPDSGAFAARSSHPNGVNGMTMDGAVHFVSNSIRLEVWRALGTRAGGDRLSDDQW